jgi:hypothetical protein
MPQLAALSPLQILIAALPPEVLRAALLAVLTAGDDEATKPAPIASHVTAAPQPRPPQVHRGWPKGVPRGKHKATTTAGDPKRAERLHRNAKRRRDQRAAARARKASNGASKPTGSNGKGNGALTPAQAVWKHAMALQPKMPWRIVSRELGVQEAQWVDCYRRGELPPNIAPNAIERFLAMPVAAG